MKSFWLTHSGVEKNIYLPKFYNSRLPGRFDKFVETHRLLNIGELIDSGALSASTGDELGKAAYGTGDIPFVRTSDVVNWEVKASPKQGISKIIYDEFSLKQNVGEGDVLFVKDGTYLIGNNCFVSMFDKEILFQSHILKFRVHRDLDPYLFFLALNSDFVRETIRSYQFSSDIIDTIGNRYRDVMLPIPQSIDVQRQLAESARQAIVTRARGKAFIKHSARMMEGCLSSGSIQEITKFQSLNDADMASEIRNEAVSSEFGSFTSFWQRSSALKNDIILPKYYDTEISHELEALRRTCEIITIGSLRQDQRISYQTGDEVGKAVYGTGSIPFLRTSDFSNWEIIHNPKQGVSEEVFESYRAAQDLKENDILLVRDGTYLVGSSAIVTSNDTKSLYCGGLIKIRVHDLLGKLDPFLFLGLLNSYIVKRQIRSRQFTRDVIDTLGTRLEEVFLPIPLDAGVRSGISQAVRLTINERVAARVRLSELSRLIIRGSAPA